MSPPKRQLYQNAIKQLLIKIDAKHAPEVVVLDPSPDAAEKNCFYNVERHVRNMGGKAIYGWAIGISPFLVEAEKHAVWQMPDDRLLDITPRTPAMPTILFVRDTDFVYTGQYIDNIRLNVTTNPLIDDWIKICESIEVLFSFGNRSNEYEISISETIIPFLNHLEDLKVKYGNYIAAGGNPDTPCFCGRSLIYKNCHGPDMMNIQNSLEKTRAMFGSAI